ncbi:hypothetical protein GOBAR_DD18890 [Gossypium barbadense]|nr:hypothetical protein GOBAR_DD18890 [Gossypium barbadense]
MARSQAGLSSRADHYCQSTPSTHASVSRQQTPSSQPCLKAANNPTPQAGERGLERECSSSLSGSLEIAPL